MNKLKEIILNNYIVRALSWFFSGIMILLVKVYQYLISPLLPRSCRFYPSCSEYSIQAFRIHGFFRGFILTVYRVSRCHPWGGHGDDPVPEKGSPVFRFKKYKNEKEK